MKAVQFGRFGGPEVLQLVDVPAPVAGPGELLVRVRAAGVNLSDALMREDRYAVTPALPAVPGNEVVGEVVEVGREVKGFARGDRVALSLFAAGLSVGGYAELVAADARFATHLPPELPFEDAAALMVQGLTALALTRHTPVAGKSVLVSAAAGGVGSLLLQLLVHAGARQVIAAASTAEKRAHTLALGADAAVDYTARGWTEQVRALTGGSGPDVVLESVGGDVTAAALSVLAPRGVMVVYGALNIQRFSLGVPELLQLIFKNQAVLGFALVTLLTPETLREDLTALFRMAKDGRLRVSHGGRFGLADAAEAHRALQSRRTVGKLVLVP
ncbi:MAG TPA: zinc-binding dehydrogenase [Myxococcaceae bacterium]|nr:zinc-binding dehydrogenase [Myxococcaceae bacterium]